MLTTIVPCTLVQSINVCNQNDANDFKRKLEKLQLAYFELWHIRFSVQEFAAPPTINCSACKNARYYERDNVCLGLLPNENIETKDSQPYSLHIIHASTEAIAPYIDILSAQEHKLQQSEPEILLLFELAKANPNSHQDTITVENLDLSELQSIQNIIGIFLCGKVREEIRDSNQLIDINGIIHNKNLEVVRLLLFSLQNTIQDRLVPSSKTNSQLTSSTNTPNPTQNSQIIEKIDYHSEENPYPQSFQLEYSYSEADDWQIMLPGILSDELHPQQSNSDLLSIFIDTTPPHQLNSELSTDALNPNFEQIHSPQIELSNATTSAKNINDAFLIDSGPPSPSLNTIFQPNASHSPTTIMVCPDGQAEYILQAKILSSDLPLYINSKLPSISCKVKTIDSILHKPYIALHFSETGEVKIGKSEYDFEPKLGFAHIHKDVYQKLCNIHAGRKHPFNYAQSILTVFDSSIKFPDPKGFPDKESAEALAYYLFNNNLYDTIVSAKEQLLIFLGIITIDLALDLLKLQNSQESDKQGKKISPKRLMYTRQVGNLNHRPSIPFTINAIDIALEQYFSQGIGLSALVEVLKPIEQQSPIEQITSPENDFTIELPEQITSEIIKTFLQKTEKLPQPPPSNLYVPCVVFQPLPTGKKLNPINSNNYARKKIYMIVISIPINQILKWNSILSLFPSTESTYTSKLQVVKNALTFFCPTLNDIDTSALEDAIKNISLDDRKTAQQKFYAQHGTKIASKLIALATGGSTKIKHSTVDNLNNLSINIRDKNFQEKIHILYHIDRKKFIEHCRDRTTVGWYFEIFFNTWTLPESLPKKKYTIKARSEDSPPPLKIQKVG